MTKVTTIQRRLSLGLCCHCGKSPPESGKKICASCFSRQRQRYLGRKISGLCVNCATPLDVPGKAACGRCRANNLRRKVERGKDNCVRCLRGTRLPGKKTCLGCINKVKLQNQTIKDEVYKAYGGYRCSWCGTTDKEALTIDHVFNNGSQHRKEIGGSLNTLKWLKRHRFPAGFQVLCRNCNWSKHRGVNVYQNVIKAVSGIPLDY